MPQNRLKKAGGLMSDTNNVVHISHGYTVRRRKDARKSRNKKVLQEYKLKG